MRARPYTWLGFVGWLCCSAAAQAPQPAPSTSPGDLPPMDSPQAPANPLPEVQGPAGQNQQLPAPSSEMTVDQLLQLAIAYRESATRKEATRTDLDFARAIEACAKVLDMDPSNIEANLQIAEISMMRRDFNNGRDYFKRVHLIEENNYRANIGLGQFYLYTKLYRQAVLYLTVAGRVAPPENKSEALRLLCEAHLAGRELDFAKTAAEESLRIDSGNAAVLKDYVMILMMRQQFDEARQESLRLIDVTRQRARVASYDRQVIKDHIDAFDRYIEVLRSIHNELHRKNARGEPTDQPLPGREADIADVLNSIVEARASQLPILQTLSLLDVVPLCHRAVQLQPNNLKYLFTLARASKLAGMYGDAHAILKDLVQREPSNALFVQALQQIEAEIASLQGQVPAAAGGAQQPAPVQPAPSQPETPPPPAPNQ